MSTFTFPAIKSQMGSTTYYQASVRARDLASLAQTMGETDAWQQLSISERFQRELAERRIRDEIVPYLVRTRDRFFGALIMVVREPKAMSFEPAAKYMADAPAALREPLSEMGVLTISGSRSCVVLDGQHRFAALRAAITDTDKPDGEYRDAIADDQLSVLFLPFESLVKTRRIFNKVNRYAKPTSPSDNIITSEDDGYAIIARWLVDPEPPEGLSSRVPPFGKLQHSGESMVEWRSTKLESQSCRLTTLLLLYQVAEVVLQEAADIPKLDEKHHVNRPGDDLLARGYDLCAKWWTTVLENLTAFQFAVDRPSSIPDYRAFQHKWSLLFRPISQHALAKGLIGATQLGLTLEEAVVRANKVKWKAAHTMWTDTIVFSNGHMNTQKAGINVTGKLITYLLAADRMTPAQIEGTRLAYAQAKGEAWRKLPPPVVKPS